MSDRAVIFTAPRRVEVRERPAVAPGAGQVRVETEVSGVSAGSELLIYRGEAPASMAADATLPALAGSLRFPLAYGYACVGRVVERGAGVKRPAEGTRVFAFHPHASAFVADASDLLEVPDGVSAEAAAFLPALETAVTLMLDGRPAIGERVAVFGQGLVGLAVTALLGRMSLARLVTVERHPLRQRASRDLGTSEVLDPAAPEGAADVGVAIREALGDDGADLTYELTGVPDALDAALAATGFAGRVVLGSWYGNRRASLDLGGRFHRSRIRLLASQVSTLDPAWSGRWTRERRLAVAWAELARLDPTRLVTHRLPVERAPELYRLLDERPDEVLGALFRYDGGADRATPDPD